VAYAWLAEHEMRSALTILADALRQGAIRPTP
jgi:hypothetical protein